MVGQEEEKRLQLHHLSAAEGTLATEPLKVRSFFLGIFHTPFISKKEMMAFGGRNTRFVRTSEVVKIIGFLNEDM